MDRKRCDWSGLDSDPAYRDYHDYEWGRPIHEGRRLFTLLVLETYQAGLSWQLVLHRRAAIETALCLDDPARLASFGETEIERALIYPSMIRNRAKARAAVENAKAYLRIEGEKGGFTGYVWHWTGEKSIEEHSKEPTSLSLIVSKDLKKRGFSFVGPMVVHSFLQAAGVYSAHEPNCFLYKKIP